ncbi:hypothetical protein ACTZWT_14555 [Rhodopseudomonas sp. NSM]|uniref:hypothetical protein n=1 Tax=Rhodopseudomonas sp. NSM TaxID=3457630 RepID=UPI0040374E0C
MLKNDGVEFELLDAAGCVAAEPGLSWVQDKIAGGLRLPNDEAGNCFKFTSALKRSLRTDRRRVSLQRRHPRIARGVRCGDVCR